MLDGYGSRVCRSGVNATKSDVISVELDGAARTLTFREKDNEEIGKVEGIKLGEYCVAVGMDRGDSSVRFV